MRVTVRTTLLTGALLLGVATLMGCARPAPPPAAAMVEELDGGLLLLVTTGPTASAAVEAGLNQATGYCAARNRMIAVEGTQIERRGYQLRFRCLETGTPGVVTAAAPPPPMPGPVSAVTGAPLARAPTAAPMAASGLEAPLPRSGIMLPGASRALTPIAAGTPAMPRPTAVPAAGAQPPSSFWQTGR